MSARRLILSLCSLVAGAEAAVAKDAYVYGPAPDWRRYQQLGDAAVRAALSDPDAWQIEWPNGYQRKGWWNGKRVDGYQTCGIARATRPVSGFDPVVRFAIVIDNDVVKTVDVASPDLKGIVNVVCTQLVERGKLPPAILMAGTGEQPTTPFGLTIRAMSEGAYVTGVARGSAGEKAGISAGMVITAVNGIALADLGPGMIKLFAADAAELKLTTATGSALTLRSGK